MTCVDVRERLSAFADGEDAPGVAEHLRGCPSCSAALDELRDDLASLDAALAPAGLRADAGAARALAGLPPDRASATPVWSVPVAAAAGFLIAALFLKGAPPAPQPATKGPDPVVARQEKERQEILAEAERLFGHAEMQCSFEGSDRALRSRGAACVAPLVQWIARTDAKEHPAGRLMAARVVCDVATHDQIPELLGLLGDTEAEVRSLANRGLSRVSGLPPLREDACYAGGESLRSSWEKSLSGK